MLDFYVGQKVVCIESAIRKGPCADALVPDEIIVGEVYTIRYCGPLPAWQAKRCAYDIGVRLEEVDGTFDEPLLMGENEACLRATRFRPLIETDISIFQAMLAPKPVKQRESENA